MGRDVSLRIEIIEPIISIHAPRVGRDACSAWTLHEQAIFQSTRPVWGATGPTSPRPPLSRFQSTRPVWGATPHRITPEDWAKDFNPRAPCGARRRWNGSMGKRDHFNPRAPCGARPKASLRRFISSLFQSTRPVWGATTATTPRGSSGIFQSTRPVWGATVREVVNLKTLYISIHAPRVGRDAGSAEGDPVCWDFNPRAPCGARLWLSAVLSVPPESFQSTRPVWGATFFPW